MALSSPRVAAQASRSGFVRMRTTRTNPDRRCRAPDLQEHSTCAVALSVLLVLALLLGSAPSAAAAPQPAGAHLTVVRSDLESIVVALTVAHYEIETLSHDGEPFQRVLIPDTSQTAVPGAPQVPTRGALLGLPTTLGASLRVLEADCETLSPYKLYPASQPVAESDALDDWGTGRMVEHFVLNDELYSADSFWPTAPAELTTTGNLREQAVTQVQFYPVQHNPVRQQIRLCRRIVVEVIWDSHTRLAATTNELVSPDFEVLLRSSLLNYDSLGRHVLTGDLSERLAASSDGGSHRGETVKAVPVLKISVQHDGFYKLTYADLSNAGFNPGTVDPRTIKMSNQGAEIAITVQGESDSRFDSMDYILFYGKAIRSSYTMVNVYWLSAGDGPGQRILQRDGGPPAGTPPIHFQTAYHAEEDTAYWQTMPSLTGEDRWFWGTRLSPNTQGMPTSRDYTVHLGNVSFAGATANMRVRLKGYTGLSHRTVIRLNGQAIDDRTWQGQIQFDLAISVPHSLLRNGDNTVRVETIFSGAVVDQILVNWIEIEYWCSYLAENDQLMFGAPTTSLQRIEIRGFVSPEISLFDVADPDNPVQIINAVVKREDDRYMVAFGDCARSDPRYLALSSNQYQSAASISIDQPSAWRSRSNGADYIIITHEEFYDAALTLADHRRASGLRVATVKVGDIYDEFNSGIFDPKAIRDFLQYGYENWARPAPTFVLLFGDACQDYNDNLHTGTRNYVPSLNIESSLFGEVSSDNWFVMVSGVDSLPDMLIGRLVAQTRQEADIMVAKVIAYDRYLPDGSWNTRALFVADDDESRFQIVSEQLANRLPFYYDRDRVYAGNYPPGNPTSDIVNRVNAGSLLITYVGHGEYYAWGRWNNNQAFMFHNSDVQSLNNANKLPFVIVGNCLNGFFAGPKDSASLAEVLLRRENAGAVAVWAPTGLGYPSGHQILLNALYEAIFANDQLALGAATTAAKIATYGQSSFWGELIATYVLFGDPATRLGIPTNYPYTLMVTPQNGATGVTLDQALQVVFSRPMNPNTVEPIGPDISGVRFTPFWNADFTVVSWSHTGFQHGQTYEIKVNGKDRGGNNLGPGIAPNPWRFTTTTDNVPPDGSVTILGGRPASALTTALLEIAFSEPVRPGSVTCSISPYARGSLSLRDGNLSGVYTHERFHSGETYTFTVLTAMDIAGNSLRQPFSLTFTVGPTFYTLLPRFNR